MSPHRLRSPRTGRPLPPPGPLIAPDLAPPLAVAADPLGTAALSSRTEERPLPRTETTVAVEPVDPRATPEVVKPPAAAPPPEPALPEAEVRRRSRPETGADTATDLGVLRRASEPAGPIALTRVIPGSTPRLPEVQGTTGGRRWSEVPAVYRSRLDPNRSELAQRAGASPASEQAVERARSTGSPAIRTATAAGTARPPGTTTAPRSRATTTTPSTAPPASPASASASTGRPTPR